MESRHHFVKPLPIAWHAESQTSSRAIGSSAAARAGGDAFVLGNSSLTHLICWQKQMQLHGDGMCIQIVKPSKIMLTSQQRCLPLLACIRRVISHSSCCLLAYGSLGPRFAERWPGMSCTLAALALSRCDLPEHDICGCVSGHLSRLPIVHAEQKPQSYGAVSA